MKIPKLKKASEPKEPKRQSSTSGPPEWQWSEDLLDRLAGLKKEEEGSK